jgi:NodT family efflux transporter outer membrane factor (OMF) lipoprotein
MMRLLYIRKVIIMSINSKIFATALIALLASCAVGPDYKKPNIALPESWPESKKLSTDSKAEIDQQWWKHFNDDVLSQLIEKASTGNLDLKIAAARIAQARAARSGASSDFLPTVNATANATRQANQFAFPQPIPGIATPFNTFKTGFDASWEPDIFGGKRRFFEAKSADLAASEASFDAARVSLFAEIASSYIDIRKYQAQLAITTETIAAEQKTFDIVSERYHTGKTSELDQTQAKAQLEQMRTQLPYYQNLVAQAEYSIDLLLGEQPGYVHKITSDKKAVPVVGKEVVLAAPANVIANRPDIKVAEQQLVSATAQQGVAVAAFFPDISLSGFIGFLNVDASHLLESGSKSWTGGGNILLPILNYGKLSANLDSTKAKQQEALAVYQKSIVSALSDVAKSVTAYTKQEEYKQALGRTVTENRKTADIARMRYKEGVSSFIDVLDAERTLYAAESQLMQSKAQSSQNLVAVYKSLGGGWKGN